LLLVVVLLLLLLHWLLLWLLDMLLVDLLLALCSLEVRLGLCKVLWGMYLGRRHL
jgi:hypothetical protein